jgi:hypothetical protein
MGSRPRAKACGGAVERRRRKRIKAFDKAFDKAIQENLMAF